MSELRRQQCGCFTFELCFRCSNVELTHILCNIQTRLTHCLSSPTTGIQHRASPWKACRTYRIQALRCPGCPRKPRQAIPVQQDQDWPQARAWSWTQVWLKRHTACGIVLFLLTFPSPFPHTPTEEERDSVSRHELCSNLSEVRQEADVAGRGRRTLPISPVGMLLLCARSVCRFVQRWSGILS